MHAMIELPSLNRVALLVLMALPLGCTSITVRPVESHPQMAHICIEENPKVIVEDFLPAVRDSLSRHGVSSEVFSGETPQHCEFTMAYTALRSWDFAPYLAHAELRIERGSLQVGYAEFHLRGKGGYSLFKWQGTKTKMDPVIDRLFANE
jgi:hypothetical protein